MSISSLRSEAKAFDPAIRAEVDLNRVLDADSVITRTRQANISSVETELMKDQLIRTESSRFKSRVLFITTDQSVLKTGDVTQQFFIDLEVVFDEVHIMVLGRRGFELPHSVRLSAKVWVYTVATRFFFQLPFATRSLAQNELNFTDGFRADIIVAQDPFESAAAAYLISKRFNRPLQVHVTDDAFSDEKVFVELAKENSWRLRFMHFVLKRAQSVRTSTESLRALLKKRYKHIEDLALLPRFFNTKALLALPPNPIEDVFPQFSFTVLFIGDLSTESTLFRALDAMRPLLRTPSIGFVVIGDGSQKKHFKERAVILGINEQVLFLGDLPDPLPYLLSADLLLVTDTSSESEDLVIKAAAVGTPIIMAETPVRRDLFKDGESAFLCPPEAMMAFSDKLRRFINSNALRTQFADNARTVIQNRIEDNPDLYRLAYRDTIEQVLFNIDVPPSINTTSSISATDTPVVSPEPRPTVLVDGIEMKVPDGMKK